eukprot:218636_1
MPNTLFLWTVLACNCQRICIGSASYSDIYGLICISNGYVYSVDFHNVFDYKVEWRLLSKIPTCDDHYDIYGNSSEDYMCCVVDNNRKLYVAHKWMQMTIPKQLYDFHKNEWMELNNYGWNKVQLSKRSFCQMFYDKYQNRIYFGGSSNNGRAIKCHDLSNDEWIILPCTKYSHVYAPKLWTEFSGSVLCIASNNRMEYINLGTHKNKWMIKRECGEFGYIL